MKRVLLLLVSLAALALAAPGQLPDRPPFNTPVVVRTGPEGTPLPALIRTLARAAGVKTLVKELPEETVIADLPPTPFREVLPLLLKLYAPDYTYALLPDDLVVIGPGDVVAKLAPPAKTQVTPSPQPGAKPDRPEKPAPKVRAGTVTLTLEVEPLGPEAERLTRSLSDKVKAAYVEAAGLLVITGPPDEVARIAPVVREAVRQARAHAKPEAEPQLEVFPLPKSIDPAQVAATLQAYGLKARALASPPAVLVEGTPDDLAEVERILALLTERAREEKPKPQAKTPAETRALPVPNGFDPKPLREVFPDLELLTPAPGVLVLRGNPKELDRAEAFVQTLIQRQNLEAAQDRGDRVLKGYPIFGDPEEIRLAIEKAIAPALPAGSTFVVLEKQKAVVLDAPRPYHVALVNLLKEIDPPKRKGEDQERKKTPTSTLRVPVSTLSADQARDLLEKLGMAVGVIAEPDGKALILSGPADQVELARRYLQQADRSPAQATFQVQVLTFTKSSFQELNTNLSGVLGGLTFAFLDGQTSISRIIPGEDTKSFLAALRAAAQSGKAKTILDTRLTAQDGETSKIKSGGSIVWATGGGNNQEGGGQNQPLTNLDYGVVLTLSPAIYYDPEHRMDLEVKVEVGDLPKAGPVPNSIDIPKRELEGRFLVREGEAVVLGGILQTFDSHSESGVPILKDIPLIGEAFKERESITREEYLLVVLSPVEVRVPDLKSDLPQQVSTTKEDSRGRPDDPRMPPPPPPKSPGVRIPKSPLIATTAVDPVQPGGVDLPREAPWYRARVVPGDGRLIVYVYGGPKTAYMRVRHVYVVRGKAGVELSFQVLRPYEGVGRLAILAVDASPELEAGEALAIVVEDELGHTWTVRTPLPESRL